MLDALPDGVVVLSPDGTLIDVNDGFCRMYGYSRREAIGSHARRFVLPESRDVLQGFLAAFARGESPVGESRDRRKDGSTFPVEARGSRIRIDGRDYIVVVLRDISRRRREERQRRELERQVLHAQKLESLGVLAGGIAHDFNNLLMAISGHADLALGPEVPRDDRREHVVEIKKVASRAADLCNQLLAYSGRGKFITERVDLSDLVSDMASMLRVSVSKKAVLRYRFGRALPAVEVDATQARQVILNLVTNASEALGGGGGTISLSTRSLEPDEPAAFGAGPCGPLRSGRHVALEVEDDGYGMEESTRARIFDPFFSTKFAGRGLGLAAVLGIVRGHGGALRVESTPGTGTRFTVVFPAAAPLASLAAAAAEVPARARRSSRAGGTLLLAEDEEVVRSVVRELLERAGYSVITARDGREAVEIFRRRRAEIDGALLDLTMPHLDGDEVFRELRRIQPDVRVVLSSGYGRQDVERREGIDGLAGFIQKPYNFDSLVDRVREAFGGQAP